MAMLQEDEAMEDLDSDKPFTSHTSGPNTRLSLGSLFSLVERSLDNAITKHTGWAWKEVDAAIHIHDIVLSLRHMKHGITTVKANIGNSATSEALEGESNERPTFSMLLEEVERNDKFLSGTMRSYLEDALDSLDQVKSSIDSPGEAASHSMKPMEIRKLRNAVHCLALQRDPLQAFSECTTELPTMRESISEAPLHSAVEPTAEDPIPDMMPELLYLPQPQATAQRTDTTMSKFRGPRLAELIKGRLTKSAFSKSDFFPQYDLEELLDEATIKRELRKGGCGKDPELAAFIQNHAKRTFAILAYRGLIKYATGLNIYKFTDAYLPIEEKVAQVTSLNGFLKDDSALDWFLTWRLENVKAPFPSSEDSEASSDEEIADSNTTDWANIRNFRDTQWIFLARVFKKGAIFEILHDKCPLPIIKYKKDVASGGFSVLHKGRIHPAHQVGLITGELIAIKELKDDKSRSEKAYNVELDALEMVQKLDHDRIVKFFAGFEQDGQRYLMFQWVDGGNLREFWEREPSIRDRATIEWALNEIKGLAEALKSWHNYDPDPSSQRFCRHGDLKPENIVLDRSTGGRGKFLIADMGLAKIHSQPTHVRRTPSWGLTGTLRYLAPELNSIAPQISRSIDIWSFGCILLEFIIWILYGYEALHTFNTSLSEFSNRFYIFVGQELRLHPTVQLWIDHMMNTSLTKQGPSMSGALGAMLRLVHDRLLIEDPESNGGSTIMVNDRKVHIPGTVPTIITTTVDEENTAISLIPRAKIGEVCEVLSKIVQNTSSNYSYDPTFPMNAQNGSGPQSRQSSLHENTVPVTKLRKRQQDQDSLDSGFGSGSVGFASTQHPYVTPELSDTWEIYTDNQFAKDVFRSLDRNDILEILPAETTSPIGLCENCSKKDGGILFGRGYSSRMSDIKTTAHVCNLCRILSDTSTSGAELTYYRNRSSLATSKNGPPVWSLVVGPGALNASLDIQRGFPLLPEPGGSVQAELLRQWVHDCNSNHICEPKSLISMPTRLIDLKTRGDPNDLNLDCSAHRQDKRYVALSHRWGDPDKHKSICLLKDNLEQWQRHINLSKLPQTFQDAVNITRQLGLRYLWIDSLCILQDSENDWKTECQRMEDVFSFANVTLSATCSSGVKDGFIRPDSIQNFRRRTAYPLDFITRDRERTRFYLCDAIDDFKRDVEDSELSTRGWVFQERALSRRIIHFTKTQLYWECGEGIRSETLNRLCNSKSAFMSDPEFPTSMASQYKGMRIKFFEEIYRRYSEKSFTYEADKSLAMAGIERRLERVFKATAWYGILHDPNDLSYLRRSLLWRTSPPAENREAALKPGSLTYSIKYPADRQVPTWSWMAVKSSIEYMPAPFGEMDWNLDLDLEFAPSTTKDIIQRKQPTGILRGTKLPIGKHSADDDRIFDYHGFAGFTRLSDIGCVIVGTEKSDTLTKLQKHYVLLIVPSKSGDLYQRIGVATIFREPSWIFENPKRVRIA
ncbi:uncharacterized protein K460DRAFT_390954 [Cucurbitaria berberidis CBS 394.84]|uniref:Protein kinase domain-containing protein n=1 Tax=Cucurbitaria berberidis CBS 394.84 TaxID=1168544 RepID=A0A9P4GSC1_9PLEO|nr:uncharacterized protein K460DRAFT_390954 [Cucurbitaria berberidis CBS 394.84]KAF1850450.1 hypothetical protein K460DRAFT_390954 [Cucurbitaria berberidis CBS 394.84]